MKKPKIQSRFSLNKQTVAHLTAKEQRGVRGGCELTECVSGSAAYQSSSAVIYTTVVYPYDHPYPCREIPPSETDPT